MTPRERSEARGRRRRPLLALLRVARPLAVALLIVVAARPEPIASGPRPPTVLPGPVASGTVAPLPHVDERFATLPYVDRLGRPGTWVLAASAKPLAVVVEREVAQRYGLDAVGRALEVWNDTPGSDFAVHLAGITDEGVDGKRRDGVNRVFLDRQSCGERFLARAHLFPATVESQDGRSVAWVTEVDIGVCERLSPEQLAPVMRHELAHVAGVGHLCDPDEECWTPAMGRDNRCRIMATAAYRCQELVPADEEALAHLHPRLPRIGARDAIGVVASAASVLHPRTGTADRVVVTDVDAPPALQLAATVYAGVTGAPHLLADADCTHGRDAVELNRLAAIDATVVLVGPLSGRCEDELRLGWQLDVERLADVEAVTAAVAAASTDGPTRLVVAPAPAADPADLPTAVLAVPVAAGLDAPLVTAAAEDLVDVVADVVRTHPTIRGVVLVGTHAEFAPRDVSALEDAGIVRVRPITAPDGVDVAAKVARMRDVFPLGPVPVVAVAADSERDAAAAATVAGTAGALVVPVFTGAAAPDVRVGQLLDERVDGGWLVADTSTVDPALHVRLSRAVDGAR